MDNNLFFTNTFGSKLFGILSNPSNDFQKPIVILVHGSNSSHKSKNITKLSEMLNKHNISTFRIDLFGHGDSEGKFEDATVGIATDCILSAIEFLKSKGYCKIGLMGSSFGGIASLIAASKTKNLFALGLKSPVSNYIDLYSFRKTDVDEWKKKGYKTHHYSSGSEKQNYSFYEDALKNDGYKAAEKITIPTLIVHGNLDQDVPVKQSIKLSKHLPNGRLVIIDGADHRYTNEEHANQMLNELSKFFNQFS